MKHQPPPPSIEPPTNKMKVTCIYEDSSNDIYHIMNKSSIQKPSLNTIANNNNNNNNNINEAY